MPTSVAAGPTWRVLNVGSVKRVGGAAALNLLAGAALNVLAGATATIQGKLAMGSTGVLSLGNKANPATCAIGDVNVATAKLYLCTATNTWTVVGSQS